MARTFAPEGERKVRVISYPAEKTGREEALGFARRESVELLKLINRAGRDW